MRFSREQTSFLLKELGTKVPADVDFKMTRSQWIDLKEKVFMIEAEEARPDGELSDRGRVAVSICDMRYED